MAQGTFTSLGTMVAPGWGTAVGAVADLALGMGGEDDNQGELMRLQNDMNAEQRREEWERQRDFQQMGIRWRAQDAAAAGFHPAVALGVTPSSYSPTVVGAQIPPSSGGRSNRGQQLEDFASNVMGQNLTRARTATQTDTERRLEELTIRNAELRNSLLEGQISELWAGVLGQPKTPGMPSATGGTSAPAVGAILTKPSERISHRAGDAGIEAASTPGFKNFNVAPGVSIDLPGQQMSESIEAMGPMAGPVLSTIRAGKNRLFPEPPSTPLPDTHHWSFNRWSNRWTAEPKFAPSWRGSVSGRGSARR